jgi:UDP-N-acetylmuramoylalanine--D-glutamate ligase
MAPKLTIQPFDHSTGQQMAEMELEGKKAVVVGLGITGRTTARFLKSRGAVVWAVDSADRETLADAVAEMTALGVETQIGPHRPELLAEADLIVVSPGVPHTLAPLAAAAARGIPLLGEIELAARFLNRPIIAVSGTNGKTTTTTLVGRMLEKAGMRVFVGGNIGSPLIGFVAEGQDADVAVVEVSSFQLDTADTFRPKVAVLLNVAEDHLDRYPGMEGYAAAKARLFRNLSASDTAVFNGGDPQIREMTGALSARRLPFRWENDREEDSAEGAVLSAGKIRIRMAEVGITEMSCADFALPGPHNLENAAAAALAALAAGARLSDIEGVLETFDGLSHRLERVGTVDGVAFYDDSKATNVDAVRRALESFSEPVVLLLGGRDKNTDLTPLANIAAPRVRHAVVMGEAAPRLKEILTPVVPVTEAGSMDAAVHAAFSASRPGTVVLLSPACASFDWYENYARRGEDFRRAVEALAHREKNR